MTDSTRAEHLGLLDRLAFLGQVDLGDVAELLDGEAGDADGRDLLAVALLEARPLVVLRVVEVVGILARSCFSFLVSRSCRTDL